MSDLAAPLVEDRPHAGGRPLARVVRSEFLKLVSVRTTALFIAAMLGCGLGVSVLYALTAEQGGIPAQPSTAFTLDAVTLGTVVFGQILAGVWGVLVISSDYSSGTIHATLVATPQRVRVVVAKALVLFPLTTAIALLSLVGSWAITYPIYADLGIQTGIAAPGFAFALLGGAVYVGLCAMFGLGIGTLLRSAVGGAIVVFVTVFLAPVLTSVLPASEVLRTMRVFLLSHAGDSMARLADPLAGFADVSQQSLSPAGGWITATAWALVALTAGAIALRRRDA